MEDIRFIQDTVIADKQFPEFKAGDNVTVYYLIFEGEKQRTQAFKGDVLQRKGRGKTQTFTVKKVSNGIGVERVFPLYSPSIDRIEVNKRGAVRRARLYYLRGKVGKAARIKESRK
jgi:large subunit ribosomal protein L19